MQRKSLSFHGSLRLLQDQIYHREIGEISSSKEGLWSILEANTTLMGCNWKQFCFLSFKSLQKNFQKPKYLANSQENPFRIFQINLFSK